MTISKPWLAGIVALALLVGLAFGRFALPAKTIERDHIVTTEHDTELTWHAYVGHTETKTEQQTKWVTTTKWLPGGTVVQTVQAQQDSKTEQVTQVNEQDSKRVETEQKHEEIHERLVEAKKPDWILGAGAGLDFKDRTPIYRGEVDRRIVGPVFLGISGQWPAAAGLEVKLLF